MLSTDFSTNVYIQNTDILITFFTQSQNAIAYNNIEIRFPKPFLCLLWSYLKSATEFSLAKIYFGESENFTSIKMPASIIYRIYSYL